MSYSTVVSCFFSIYKSAGRGGEENKRFDELPLSQNQRQLTNQASTVRRIRYPQVIAVAFVPCFNPGGRTIDALRRYCPLTSYLTECSFFRCFCCHFILFTFLVGDRVVCYTAVLSVVTQRLWRGVLRDDTKNGCVAD